jgi:hypothetical protein
MNKLAVINMVVNVFDCVGFHVRLSLLFRVLTFVRRNCRSTCRLKIILFFFLQFYVFH